MKITKILAVLVALVVLLVIFGLLSSIEPKSEAPRPEATEEVVEEILPVAPAEPLATFLLGLDGTIDTETSSLGFVGRTPLTTQAGSIPLGAESMLEISEAGEIVGGMLVFDMARLGGESDGLADHLKNADFFDVEKYPTATYAITSTIETPLDPDHDLIINGELTLLDQTHPHNIVAAFDRESFTFIFTTSINRTTWGVSYNSAGLGGELGDRAIDDMVSLEGTIVLEQAQDEGVTIEETPGVDETPAEE